MPVYADARENMDAVKRIVDLFDKLAKLSHLCSLILLCYVDTVDVERQPSILAWPFRRPQS